MRRREMAGEVAGDYERLREIAGLTSEASAPTESYPEVFHSSTERKVPQRTPPPPPSILPLLPLLLLPAPAAPHEGAGGPMHHEVGSSVGSPISTRAANGETTRRVKMVETLATVSTPAMFRAVTHASIAVEVRKRGKGDLIWR